VATGDVGYGRAGADGNYGEPVCALDEIVETIRAVVNGVQGQLSQPALDVLAVELIDLKLICGAFDELRGVGSRPRERSRALVDGAQKVVAQSIHPGIALSVGVVLAANGLADLVVDALEEYRSETSS
jgi:hypothetical protein